MEEKALTVLTEEYLISNLYHQGRPGDAGCRFGGNIWIYYKTIQ